MYIEPNSTIKIYSGVPLDKNYIHTLYFNDINAQNAYFHGTQKILKAALANNSYQRAKKGSMRVAIKADVIYDCNYIAFQNTSYGSKWFYAFITGIDYVNNETSEITYEIDVMQTYFFDVELKACFVEREHSKTDVIGEHTEAEPVACGNYKTVKIEDTDHFSKYVCVIAHGAWEDASNTGGLRGGVFTGLDYVAGEITSAEGRDSLIAYLQAIVTANEQDSVVSVFLMPTDFYYDDSITVRRYSTEYKKATTIDGYSPKNNKLLTYPYTYLEVDAGTQNVTYRQELFSSGNMVFLLEGDTSCNPEISCTPRDYNGASLNYTEKTVMSGFPQVAWTIDSFRAWVAQNTGNKIVSSIKNIVTANVAGAAGDLMEAYNASIASNTTKGYDSGGIDCATGAKNFYFKTIQIDACHAKIVDEFFNMYGYATNRVKVPNRNSRPHWNYVKTRDCTVIGKCPSDDLAAIANIYDRGITFWKNADEVGKYDTLDNRP